MIFIPDLGWLHNTLVELIPMFRIIWAGEIAVAAVLITAAYFFKKNTERRKMPVVLGIIGALMGLSSLAQLITSFI